jgi:hypothetical protein
MRQIGKSRRDLFEEVERKALAPLPATAFDYAEWKSAKVHPDYQGAVLIVERWILARLRNVEVDKTFYSVPHRLIGRQVDVRLTHRVVEIFLDHKRIASHVRGSQRSGHVTVNEHMPKSHQRYANTTPEDSRLRLKTMYLTLDPVRLLRDIRLAQERLVEIADKPDGSPSTGGEALPLEDFLSGLRIAWRGGEVKPTAARSKPAAKRERRRPDPLLAVTIELEEWFEAEPWRTSREFLERLQVKYPGVYPDGLIRTVQRRMKIWRSAQANALVFGPFADAALDGRS